MIKEFNKRDRDDNIRIEDPPIFIEYRKSKSPTE